MRDKSCDNPDFSILWILDRFWIVILFISYLAWFLSVYPTPDLQGLRRSQDLLPPKSLWHLAPRSAAEHFTLGSAFRIWLLIVLRDAAPGWPPWSPLRAGCRRISTPPILPLYSTWVTDRRNGVHGSKSSSRQGHSKSPTNLLCFSRFSRVSLGVNSRARGTGRLWVLVCLGASNFPLIILEKARFTSDSFMVGLENVQMLLRKLDVRLDDCNEFNDLCQFWSIIQWDEKICWSTVNRKIEGWERIFEECCSVLAGRLQSGVLFWFRLGV